MYSEIHYVDAASEGTSTNAAVITYVGGPYADRREFIQEGVRPAAVFVPAQHGLYRQSVRCADDGALRYVWENHE
jgi:hypothetical protein